MCCPNCILPKDEATRSRTIALRCGGKISVPNCGFPPNTIVKNTSRLTDRRLFSCLHY